MTKCHFEISQHGYGKNHIKLLHVDKSSPRHQIGEYEINVSLQLNNINDYTDGCNKSVITTDSQKNTIYILAKKHGIDNPEDFAILVCNHFLATYQQVIAAKVEIDKLPWQRLMLPEEHNHAFVQQHEHNSEIRKVLVRQKRNDEPIVSGGMKGLRLLKTAQSGFVDFVNDRYRSMPDTPQRIFSTSVSAVWEFNQNCHRKIDFDGVYITITNVIVEKFAGHCKLGVYSASVQATLYQIECEVLNQLPQVERIYMEMSNNHYFDFDFSKFDNEVIQATNFEEVKDNYVYVPVDKPSGMIFAELSRNYCKL